MNKPFLSHSRIVQMRSTSGFTLIELLVVISIIAVLAGLLLPVTGAVMENARKADAKSTEMQIVAAVKNFQTEYGVYPVAYTATPPVNPVDTTYDKGAADASSGKGGNNKPLFAILRATDDNTTANPSPNTRRIVYFEGRDAKSVSLPKGGFVPTATGNQTPTGNLNVTLTTGDLVDPWGNLYCVRFDSDYSDALFNPYPASTDSGGSTPPGYTNTGSDGGTADAAKVLRFGVVSWSPGKNGKMGNDAGSTGSTSSITYGDDVVSWQ